MGMYLELAAVSDGTIERLHADPPLVWQIMTPDEPERVGAARAESRSRPGLLARLFGPGAAQPPESAPPPLELGPGEGNLELLDMVVGRGHGLMVTIT